MEVCDDSAIREVLEELGDVPVLLKCTVPPDMLETYGSNVTYNPEFLRAKRPKKTSKIKNISYLVGQLEAVISGNRSSDILRM